MTDYWCCRADFGEHELTCHNFLAPSEPRRGWCPECEVVVDEEHMKRHASEPKVAPLCQHILGDGSLCGRPMDKHLNPRQFVIPKEALEAEIKNLPDWMKLAIRELWERATTSATPKPVAAAEAPHEHK